MDKRQRQVRYLEKTYNLTEIEANRLLDVKRCEICGVDLDMTRRAVDHNHETGRVRGVLCQYCNRTLLGNCEAAAKWVGIGTEDILDRIRAYVRKYGG